MSTDPLPTVSAYSAQQIRALRFDDVRAGDSFDLGSRTLSAAEMITFASQYDPQPFHLSDEGAKGHPLFARMSASGWQTGIVLQNKLADFWRGTRVNGLAGAGIDEIRWVVPVYANEALHCHLVVEDVIKSASRPDRGRIKMKATAHKDGGALAMLLRITGVFAVEPRPLPAV